ncbi:MAG: efflux RND transporter periplasmic adaptor subunit [Bacteroidales bacterium]
MRNIHISLIIAGALFTGCHTHDNEPDGSGSPHTHGNEITGSSGAAGHGHDHEHEEVSMLFTSYTESWEIFAEADPFVTGKNSTILVHVTSLHDFKPPAEARVTTSLICGESLVSQEVEKPLRPGIYRFNLQPTEEGVARLVFEIGTGSGTENAESGNFNIYRDEHRVTHEAADMHQEVPGSVTFTKEQSWIIGFATGQAVRQPFGPVIKTVGVVQPAQGDEITLTAHANGIVTFTGIELYEGITVQNGQHLFDVAGGSLAEGNTVLRYREARNNYERARADHERISKLAAERIVSEKELLQATNEYNNARAVYETLQANFSESGQKVSSPFGGYLSGIYISNGQYVEAGQPLAAVSRSRNMIIRAELQQRHSHLLNSIQTASIITGDGKAYTLEEMGGSVISMARSVSDRSHLLPVHLQVSNNPGLIPGTLLDIYLKTRTGESAIVVPVTSLIEEQGNFFVYVQIHPESFLKRQVQAGSSDGFYTEIVGGLTEGERIVTRGAIMVKAATAAGNIDPHSGHVH